MSYDGHGPRRLHRVTQNGDAKLRKLSSLEIVRALGVIKGHRQCHQLGKACTTSYIQLWQGPKDFAFFSTLFKIQRLIRPKSPISAHTTRIWRPRLGRPRSNFAKMPDALLCSQMGLAPPPNVSKWLLSSHTRVTPRSYYPLLRQTDHPYCTCSQYSLSRNGWLLTTNHT